MIRHLQQLGQFPLEARPVRGARTQTRSALGRGRGPGEGGDHLPSPARHPAHRRPAAGAGFDDHGRPRRIVRQARRRGRPAGAADPGERAGRPQPERCGRYPGLPAPGGQHDPRRRDLGQAGPGAGSPRRSARAIGEDPNHSHIGDAVPGPAGHRGAGLDRPASDLRRAPVRDRVPRRRGGAAGVDRDRRRPRPLPAGWGWLVLLAVLACAPAAAPSADALRPTLGLGSDAAAPCPCWAGCCGSW